MAWNHQFHCHGRFSEPTSTWALSKNRFTRKSACVIICLWNPMNMPSSTIDLLLFLRGILQFRHLKKKKTNLTLDRHGVFHTQRLASLQKIAPFEVRQSRKFDPEGFYLRRWLPELQKVPSELLHEPPLGAMERATSLRSKIFIDFPQKGLLWKGLFADLFGFGVSPI